MLFWLFHNDDEYENLVSRHFRNYQKFWSFENFRIKISRAKLVVHETECKSKVEGLAVQKEHGGSGGELKGSRAFFDHTGALTLARYNQTNKINRKPG